MDAYRSPVKPVTRNLGALVCAAVWRAEATHLALFIAVPALVSLAKLLLVFAVPLLLIVGPGDPMIAVRRGTEHLAQPLCWVMLARCAPVDAPLPCAVALPAARIIWPDPQNVIDDAHEPFIDIAMPDVLTGRHLWFAVWLLWFAGFLIRRELRGRRSRRKPTKSG